MKRKNKKSNPGDIIKTRNGMYAVVGEFGSLITQGVFIISQDGRLFPEGKSRKLTTEEKRSLR
jgi:hypothetical protein